MKIAREIQQHVWKKGSLHRRMAPWGFATDRVLLTKHGDVIGAWRVCGVDHEGRGPDVREAAADQREGLFRHLGPDFIVWEFAVKTPAAKLPDVPGTDPASRARNRRVAYLNQRELWHIERTFVLLHTGLQRVGMTAETWRERLLSALDPDRIIAFKEGELVAAIERLELAAIDVETQLSAFGMTRLDKGEIFAFLRTLVNYSELPVPPPADDQHVDQRLVEQDVHDYRNTLHVGTSRVRVMTMIEAPTKTTAGCLNDLMDIPCPFVICLTWQWLDVDVILTRLRWRQGFYFTRSASRAPGQTNLPVKENADAKALEALHRDAIEAIAKGEIGFGTCSYTLAFMHEDAGTVDRAVSLAKQVFTKRDGIVKKEVYNAVPAWLALVPGNQHENIRFLDAPSTVGADIGPTMFAHHEGLPVDEDGVPAMAILETRHQVPFYLHVRVGLDPHMLILGQIGGGKSYVANVLALWSRHIFKRLVIFDVGGSSYRKLVAALGGVYVEFGESVSTVTLNPLAGPNTDQHLEFLVEWVSMLMRGTDGYVMSGDARDELIRALRVVLGFERRSLTDLFLELADELRHRLDDWIAGGVYGWAFDHVEDSLEQQDVIAFDLFAVFQKHKTVMQPLFSLLFHRDTVWQAETFAPTLQIMEEVWLGVTDPTLRKNLFSRLKAGRKMGYSVICITQALEDLHRADIAAEVLQTCATKIVLPMTSFNRAALKEALDLTDEQVGLVKQLAPRKEMLVVQPGISRVCGLRVDPETHAICESLPKPTGKPQLALAASA